MIFFFRLIPNTIPYQSRGRPKGVSYSCPLIKWPACRTEALMNKQCWVRFAAEDPDHFFKLTCTPEHGYVHRMQDYDFSRGVCVWNWPDRPLIASRLISQNIPKTQAGSHYGRFTSGRRKGPCYWFFCLVRKKSDDHIMMYCMYFISRTFSWKD